MKNIQIKENQGQSSNLANFKIIFYYQYQFRAKKADQKKTQNQKKKTWPQILGIYSGASQIAFMAPYGGKWRHFFEIFFKFLIFLTILLRI